MTDRGALPKKLPHRQIKKPAPSMVPNAKETNLHLKLTQTKKNHMISTDQGHKQTIPKLQYVTKEMQTEIKLLESSEVQTDLLGKQIEVSLKGIGVRNEKKQKRTKQLQQHKAMFSNESQNIVLEDGQIKFLLRCRQKKLQNQLKKGKQMFSYRMYSQQGIDQESEEAQDKFGEFKVPINRNKSNAISMKLKPNKKTACQTIQLKRSKRYLDQKIIHTETGRIKDRVDMNSDDLKKSPNSIRRPASNNPPPFVVGKNRPVLSLPKLEKPQKFKTKPSRIRSYSEARQTNEADTDVEQYLYLSFEQQKLLDDIKKNLDFLAVLSQKDFHHDKTQSIKYNRINDVKQF